MFFKTLEIQGFKSFADKTVLEFDTRTTAVIGPNGNGKSNISDALRWVMGETGAKSLRGDNMEELIFHGTQERRPMGFARVVLTIDNTDRKLGVDADEVVISRRINCSGESEYLINNEKKRLRDIQELLMGTGLGRDGYSIIGQGRVSEIISARDTQRREIFEEAAGVSRSLHKKADAEKDLEKAQGDIDRMRDIIRLDEERLPSLKKQCEKALAAKELLDQKEALEISVSVARLREKRAEQQEVSDKLLLNKGLCENYERDIDKANEETEKIFSDKLSLQGELEEIRREIENANLERSEKETEKAVAENNIENNKKRREELKAELERAVRESAGFDSRIADIKARIEKEQAAADENDREAEKNQALLDDISRRDDKEGAEYSELERQLAGVLAERARRDGIRSGSVTARDKTDEQKRNFIAINSESEKLIEGYKTDLENMRATLEENKEKRISLSNRSAGMERLAESRRRRRDDLRAELEKANSEIVGKEQKLKALSDIEKNHAGYFRPVKEVLTAGEQGRITGIHGVVADVVTVPKEYVTAIETALGSAMQNIIVDNESTAERCIRFLKDTNAGRATFYPITAMKKRTLNEPRLSDETGFEGLAVDLVECDGLYSEIIGYLLGMTAIVDDIGTASVIGKKYGYKFRIVTLDGQVVNAGGSFTGGARQNKDGGIISQKQAIEALRAEVAELRSKAGSVSEEFERARSEAAKYDHELEGVSEELSQLDKSEISVCAEIKRLEDLIAQSGSQEQTRLAALKRFDDDIAEQNRIISESDEILKQLSEKINSLEEELKSREGSRAEVKDRIEEFSDNIRKFTEAKNTALANIKVCEKEIEGVENSRKLLLDQSGEYKEKQEKLDEDDRQNRETIERLSKEIAQFEGKNDSRRGEIEQLKSKIDKADSRITEIRNRIDEFNREKQSYSAEYARLDERIGNIQNEYDKIVALLFDTYNLTPTQAEEKTAVPDDLKAAEIELADLNKKITALGNVNFASIEEYSEVSERYDFNSGQLRDIEDSKKKLENIIEKLTEEIRTQFLDSFNDINRHFKDVFVQIFGEGAHAELELTDPEDVLNSGIEIKAAPPGKVIKNLISLSGGEQAMVAITIYFAILMHRPTPFCMLDEVDAPLDAVNVEKYISYVNHFSKNTQLMLISHRRGTIEGCSVLYGVFMQEKGVSRLIRQELTDDLEGVSN